MGLCWGAYLLDWALFAEDGRWSFATDESRASRGLLCLPRVWLSLYSRTRQTVAEGHKLGWGVAGADRICPGRPSKASPNVCSVDHKTDKRSEP